MGTIRYDRVEIKDETDLHPEIPPWELALRALSLRERRYLRHLMKHGDHRKAAWDAGYRCDVMELLSRAQIRVVIRRTAWLVVDPVIGAKMLMPLVMARQMEIALSKASDRNALTACTNLQEISGSMPPKKQLLLKAELTKEMLLRDEERPWADPQIPWSKPRSVPTLLASEAASRPDSEIERAVDEAVKSLEQEIVKSDPSVVTKKEHEHGNCANE